MCCHKKCINKCQNATICGPVDAVAAAQAAILPSVEFKVTEADGDIDEIDDFEVHEEVCTCTREANNIRFRLPLRMWH